MYIYKYEILVDLNLVVIKIDCQTAKFNYLPNFLAIQYIHVHLKISKILFYNSDSLLLLRGKIFHNLVYIQF